MDWIKGALKSWTMWFGTALLVLPEVWPALEPHVRELIPDALQNRVLQIVAIVIILLRARTTTAIPDK